MTYNRVMWIVLCALLIVVIGLMVRRQAALPAPTTRLGGLRVAPQAAETQSPTEVLANAAAVTSGPHITISISADAPAQIIIATPTALQATETPTMAPSATETPTAQQDPSATATQRPSDTPTSTISSTSTPTTAPSATAISTATRTATPTPVAGGGTVLLAAGDIAKCSYTRDNQTGALVAAQAGTVLALGDTVYPDGTAAEYTTCYHPAWGMFKDRTRPVPGNHEYHTAGASGYFGYFGALASPLEPDCKSNCKGYYSYDLGGWHIVALNSEIAVDGNSEQLAWLRADLAANPALCTLAYFHTPRFSSDAVHGSDPAMGALWDALYAAGADVVLNGHSHTYERFAKQNPQGAADANGIRQFIVGTGGANLYNWRTVLPTSELRANSSWGALKLTLGNGSYTWEFLPIPGSSLTDTGSDTCVSRSGGATLTPTPKSTPTPTLQFTLTPTPQSTLTPTPKPTVTPVAAGVFAFPGAEGFGAVAVGGRGGRVYPVTSLADSGAGTLRECVNASGPRICVFRTGGTIELASTLTIANPYITIAGQTAPGDGITLKLKDPSRSIDMLKITTYEVIIRYIRSRPGSKGADARALTINAGGSVSQDKVAHNIVIDHMSMSWAGDEILIAWDRTHDVTFSWNILAESLTPGLKGPNLGKYGGGNYSFHHNLVAHHVYRLPNISTSGGPTDLVNNVIYNYKTFGARVLLGAMVNMVGNYIEAGPDTQAGSYYVRNDLDVPDPDSNVPLPNPDTRGFFVAYNLLQPNYGGQLRIRDILPPNTKASDIHEHRYLAPQVTTLTAQEAYTEVLANAGAVHGLACDGTWVARPDAVDRRIVESVRLKRSSHNTATPKRGFISDPSEVGGWPVLGTGSPCPDSDGDGMFDAFESRMKYGVNVPDSVVVEANGYTRMDLFLAGVR